MNAVNSYKLQVIYLIILLHSLNKQNKKSIEKTVYQTLNEEGAERKNNICHNICPYLKRGLQKSTKA